MLIYQNDVKYMLTQQQYVCTNFFVAKCVTIKTATMHFIAIWELLLTETIALTHVEHMSCHCNVCLDSNTPSHLFFLSLNGHKIFFSFPFLSSILTNLWRIGEMLGGPCQVHIWWEIVRRNFNISPKDPIETFLFSRFYFCTLMDD